MNIALLRMLQARPDCYFWPESIARSLKISGRRLLRDLGELEQFGFGFEHLPHRGIRYTEPAQRLCVDQIEWELATRTIGRRLAVWQRVTSTNDIAARAASSRSNHGLVVLAEEQTAGRGRRQRRWYAPAQSSILMSLLIFPPDSIRSVSLLTSLAAVAVAGVAADSLAIPARIKWPNDVRADGQKFCGILVEDLARTRRGREAAFVSKGLRHSNTKQSSQPARWRAVVIGIGVNVNVARRDLPRDLASPATSLMILCGRRLDRSELVRRLIQRLDYYYASALSDVSTIWSRWHELADLIGQPVQVELAKRKLRGRLVEIRPDWGAVLELASGEEVKLPVEEVLSITDWNPQLGASR